MTNRITGVNFNAYQSGSYTEQTGTNGKTEVVDGVERLKWNPYYKFSKEAVVKYSATGNSVGLGFSGLSLTDNNLDARLLAKLDDRVKGSSFNLGMTLGESRQTFHMIRENIISIGGALIDVKHGNISQAARRLGVSRSNVVGYTRTHRSLRTGPDKVTLNDLSKRWLELQYGWLPLASDIYEGSKLIESLTSKPRVDWIRCTVNNTIKGEASQSPSLYSCPYLGKMGRKVIYERRELLSENRVLGLNDPLSIAWELMPWSFVADWFIPIGTYLQAYAALPRLTGRHCLTKFAWAETGPFVPVHPAYKTAGGWAKRIEIQRSSASGAGAFSVPRPEFKQLDQTLSGLHIANAIALVHSRLSKPHNIPVI